jgi:hypothetical protein
MKMKLKVSAYLLCEVFKWYEHEIVQAGPNIRQTPKRRSTAYYLWEQRKGRKGRKGKKEEKGNIRVKKRRGADRRRKGEGEWKR